MYVHTQLIDQLGLLRAEIARLQTIANTLEATIKAEGIGTREGDLFRGTVTECYTRSTNWKAVANTLHPSRQLVTAHTTCKTSTRLTVSARKRAAA